MNQSTQCLGSVVPLAMFIAKWHAMTDWLTNEALQEPFKIEAREWCHNEEQVYPIFAISIWLYPFSIEFHILVVAVW